ncbi:MAG: hypothetical protein KA297_32455 [Kofleriaceae bacterium]|jgi:hypothetical protein|nr:hypothetical protein [Kofleriaceae bacterium]
MKRSWGQIAAGTLLVTSLGCAEPERAGRGEVIAACMTFAEIVERRFGECEGLTDEAIASAVATAQSQCPYENNEPSCWQAVIDTYESCGAGLERKNCDENCPNGSCGYYCPYLCLGVEQ